MRLAERCLLVAVHVTCPTKNKEHKSSTEKVLKEHNATADSGRFMKALYPEDAIKPVSKQGEAVRNVVKAYSTPWIDGQYIMPAGSMLDCQADANKEIAAFNTLADNSADRFDTGLPDDWLVIAKRDRNGLFDRKDYPATRESFRKEFTVDVRFLPLADRDHILIKMADDELRIVEDGYKRQLAQVNREATDKIAEPLRNLIRQIGNYEGKKASGDRTRLCDSLIGNIREVARLVPVLDIDDAELTALEAQIKEVTSANPDVLKVSKNARDKAVAQAANVLAKLEGSAK